MAGQDLIERKKLVYYIHEDNVAEFWYEFMEDADEYLHKHGDEGFHTHPATPVNWEDIPDETRDKLLDRISNALMDGTIGEIVNNRLHEIASSFLEQKEDLGEV